MADVHIRVGTTERISSADKKSRLWLVLATMAKFFGQFWTFVVVKKSSVLVKHGMFALTLW